MLNKMLSQIPLFSLSGGSSEFLSAIFDLSQYTSLAGVFGLIATLTVLASMQFKNIKTVLIIQIICNLSGALSYLLSGNGLSGFMIYIVAVSQSVLYLIFRIMNKNDPAFVTWLFAALFILSSALTFKNWFDIFAMLGAFSCAIALAQKNPAIYRLIMVCNGLLWLTYDIVGIKPSMILAHVITVASAVIGILRLDTKLFKNKQA